MSSDYLIRAPTLAAALAPDYVGFTADFVSYAGAIVLRNESCLLGGIQFVRLGDLWSPEFGAFQQPPLRTIPTSDPEDTRLVDR